MKNTFVLVCLLSLLAPACGARRERVERTLENGVPVVKNNLLPHRVKGALSSVRLEKELTIDTERADLASQGVKDIWGFDVNSQGEIFIYQSPLSTGKLISKFDKQGRLVTSFAPKGQGPGEFQWPTIAWAVAEDRVFVANAEKGYTISVYDLDGNIVRKIRKEFASAPFPERQKLLVLKALESPQFAPLKNKLVFPKGAPVCDEREAQWL